MTNVPSGGADYILIGFGFYAGSKGLELMPTPQQWLSVPPWLNVVSLVFAIALFGLAGWLITRGYNNTNLTADKLDRKLNLELELIQIQVAKAKEKPQP